MIKGRIRSLTQIDGGINLFITIPYPHYPSEPHKDDYFGADGEGQFNAAKKQSELKKEIYTREKQEIDLMRLGLVNLFQDDDLVC